MAATRVTFAATSAGASANPFSKSTFKGTSVAAANAASPEMRPDPSVLSWSHIYLGRMHDLEDDRDQAVEEYRAALGVTNAPESARSAAQNGIEQAYKPAAKSSSPQ